MRKLLVSLSLAMPMLLGAAELAGTWKFQPPPNPQAQANPKGPIRQPRETIYCFKVEGNQFTGTAVRNGGIADIVNGAIDGSHITFENVDGSGRKTPFKGEINGEELTIQLTNPPPPNPNARGGGRGPQGPMVLRKFSGDTEYKLPAELAHKPLPPFKPIAPNGLAKTPPMGWNSWNKFNRNVDDKGVRGMADAMVASGMRDAGYIYVNIDDTWEGQRDKDGVLQSNEKFPDMKALADYVHSKGLKLGIYSGPGPRTCAGYIASYNHEEQDARTWAAWGIDYLKYDWCSASEVYHPDELKAAYQKMALALRATKRPMIYSLCQYGWQEVGEWGAAAGGNLWRTTGDIRDSWESMSNLGFDQQIGREKFAGPGHWNDPDMLEIGNGHMTDTEYRTHMSLWSILAAPLLAGNDLRSMTDATKEILLNKEVIAVDQDKAGVQGVRVRKDAELEVWKKPLEHGGVAVGLFNRGKDTAQIGVKWSEVGVTRKNVKVRDLWAHKDLEGGDGFSGQVPSHGVVMLLVK
ncbi:MAG: glycoside hydrolase family 27 protein [Acidobacteriia bacterium]|nr:glycoside hydrolase family 27 protein [Terriglobia bacterium]